MTTNTLLYQKDFFFFEPTVQSRVINPRHNEIFSSELLLNKHGQSKHSFVSNYDIEIFHRQDIADVFCNIKTKMTWDFDTKDNQKFGSYQFAESLLFHLLNQKHFATTILRQELINNFAIVDLLFKPNVKAMYDDLKKEYNFLAPLQFDQSGNFSFGYWYR